MNQKREYTRNRILHSTNLAYTNVKQSCCLLTRHHILDNRRHRNKKKTVQKKLTNFPEYEMWASIRWCPFMAYKLVFEIITAKNGRRLLYSSHNDVWMSLLPCCNVFFLKLSCFSTCSKPKTEQNNKPRRADTFATNLSPLGMGEWINMAGNNTLLFEVYHFINEINKTPLMNIYVSLLELFRQRIQNTWRCGAFDETKFSI